MDILFAHKKPYESMFHARPHLASYSKKEASFFSPKEAKEDLNCISTVPLASPKMSETTPASLLTGMPGCQRRTQTSLMASGPYH